MKIFCHIPRENWFCDRYGDEYSQHSSHTITHTDLDCDIVWLLAPWCWNQIPTSVLKNKKVICTIHHEVPWKFDESRKKQFMLRDAYVDAYHVPCLQTKQFIEQLTKKPVYQLAYWCNDELWKRYDKLESKKYFNLPLDSTIISSFQRDTEGSDLSTPKLEKGPDIFCDIVERFSKKNKVHVLLSGWRRQYVIQRLKSAGLLFSYFELPVMDDLVRLYSATDIYVVGARVEGGPQSILECSIMKTPIVSTDVGIAAQILPQECIITDSDVYDLKMPSSESILAASNNAHKLTITSHAKKYDELFETIARN